MALPAIIQACQSNGSPLPKFETDEERRQLRVVLPIHPAFLDGYEAPKGENNLFAQTKPSIGDGKPSVDVLKPSIGDVLSSVRLAKKVYANIVNLYAVVGESEVFGRSRVMEILSLSNGPAGELLVKMAALNLIIPITGQGKGKYRFNLQPPTGGPGS